MADDGIDWAGTTESMARQILAQGELYLQYQVQFALAADQRATTAASIFTSMAAAVGAAFIAFWDHTSNAAALYGGLAAAVLLLIAGVLSAWAARPTDFHTPGNYPAQWFEGRKGDLVRMIGGESESCQRRIVANDKTLLANQGWLRAAFRVAALAPVISFLVWYCAR